MKQYLLLLLSATFAIYFADGAASSSTGETTFTLRQLTLSAGERYLILLSNSSSSNDTSIPSNETSIPSNETSLPEEPDESNETSIPEEPDESNETSIPEEPEEPGETNETSIPEEPDETDETNETSIPEEPDETDQPVDDTYDRIMAMQNQTFAHRCFVTVIEGGPFVWCDISVPMNLNVTAEIRDGTCDEFTTTASSEFYTRGLAQPIFFPEVTEEEKLMGTFDHSYCAGVDILYYDVNVTTGDAQQVSLLSGRFAMDITYNYDETVDEESGKVEEELSSAKLSDENSKAEEGNRDLEIGLAVLAGAVLTLALVAIIYGKKKTTRRRRQEENIEIAPMIAQDNEENDII